ncbi:MAG: tyrosine-type recombinase/integrase, partial [Rhodospirillaceae bacterium]|nr:tyrosine-type recombinase/integrase [Rhodospirillaceae bacterium]
GQAHGLTAPLRRRLLAVPGDRLIEVRNRALLAVAYDGMLRRAELVALQVTDLLEEMRGDATLLVRRSKTDGEGYGDMLYLARDTVRLVRAWLDRSGITDGRLFRSVGKGGRLGEGLDPSQVPRILKGMAQRAGLPAAVVRDLSGHSARVGAAQDMIAAGIELPAVLQAGRWKSTAMVNRYGERLLARRSGMAQLARLQRRD